MSYTIQTNELHYKSLHILKTRAIQVYISVRVKNIASKITYDCVRVADGVDPGLQ